MKILNEYKTDYIILAHREKSMNVSSALSTCHIDRTLAIPTCNHKNMLSATYSNKEMIIDYLPEHRDQLNGDFKSHVNSAGISIPTFRGVGHAPRLYKCITINLLIIYSWAR